MRLAADREILPHGGQTGAFRAVVAFANSAVEPSTTDLALHILIGLPVSPTPPVQPPPAKRTEIPLPAAELDKFVGRYDFGNTVVVAITRDGDSVSVRNLREEFVECVGQLEFPFLD